MPDNIIRFPELLYFEISESHHLLQLYKSNVNSPPQKIAAAFGCCIGPERCVLRDSFCSFPIFLSSCKPSFLWSDSNWRCSVLFWNDHTVSSEICSLTVIFFFFLCCKFPLHQLSPRSARLTDAGQSQPSSFFIFFKGLLPSFISWLLSNSAPSLAALPVPQVVLLIYA